MRGLAILVVIAGAAYLLYTQGLPTWREHQAAKEAVVAEGQRAGECVRLAKAASASFGSEIRQFSQPPIDQGLWANFLLQIGGDLSTADNVCSCPAEACASASAALLELRGLVNDLNTFVRTAGPPVMNGANRLETVERMLDRASKQLD